MNRRIIFLFAIALLLMAGTAGVLAWFKTHQRLGVPGLKTSALPGSRNLVVDLPEQVMDYTSKQMDIPALVINSLPRDTSFGQRVYRSPDGFETLVNAVLMGVDRTSIHKPQFCLAGQGWNIDRAVSEVVTVPVSKPHEYDLPVMKVISTKTADINGQSMTVRGLYVYWFVADDRVTAEHWQRMWWMAENLLRTGVLQRWAYVSCFSLCLPGQEEATFNRMKEFIAVAVPKFQLAVPPFSGQTASALPASAK